MKELKIAIVGYGGMGGYHESELIAKNPYVSVKGVYDIDQKRMDIASGKKLATYSSFEDLLNDDEIDAVLIATPNDSHKELVIKSFRK